MTGTAQQVVVVSGLSGAGKSTVLNTLEDMGFHCIDNLPLAMLGDFGREIQDQPGLYSKVALGIDARAPGLNPGDITDWLKNLKTRGIHCQLLFMAAEDATLIKRFSETRRRHPLAEDQGALQASITRERQLMEPVREYADHEINTSTTNIHQLRHLIWQNVGSGSDHMTLVLQSFGLSQGVPGDIDYLFDVRCLPNPHWNTELRPFNGRDARIAEWLEQDDSVTALVSDIRGFLETWLPCLEVSHRSFVTVAVGCTGGRHRSVYVVERLGRELQVHYPELKIHHRDLDA